MKKLLLLLVIAVVETSHGYKPNINYVSNNVKSDKEKIKRELYFTSAPGHCKPICPCYMNGVSYDHGDRWQKTGDPCTTYECGNGMYTPVIQGVRYKGACKNVGTTWTEGCFTYKVQVIKNRSIYRLIEGGCKDDDGNCWRVGDQFKKNCNLYECQIVGTCYTISLISKGCTFEGQCKEVNNYWHDGCSIFQCMDYNGKTDYERLHHEVMYWPHGNYGLLKPKSGCPVDVEEEWSEGHRGHFGNGHNYKSYDFDAYGEYEQVYFIQHFCIRQQVDDLSIMPRYQTYWEPGKYCIFRKKDVCPERFRPGLITMDDLDVTEELSTANGTLPDGIYSHDTSFYFCCRDDGKLDVPIVLPKERPFILFVDSSADKCQEVRGMSHTLEFFAFDDTDGNPKPATNGSIPMMKDGDNNTEIYFCHYKPMDCGCDDGDGNTVIVGDRVKKGCSWYTCKDMEGIRMLTVDTGGCIDEQGHCRNESEIWMVSTGVTCYQKRCVRTDTGTKVKFEIKLHYRGCKDGEFCRPINYRVARGCYSSVCTARPDRPECYFKMQKAGCTDGKGGCIPLGKEYKKGCMTYLCSKETSKCGMKFVKGACKYDDGCHEVGEVWHHSGCHKLKCSMSRKGKSITFSIDSIEQECNYRGKCYKAGYNLKEGCYRKQCKVDAERRIAYMNIVDGGCNWKGKCMGVNTTWYGGCTEYICRWYQKDHQHIFKSEINNRRCTFGSECVNHGEIRKHDCTEYECVVTYKGDIQYGIMKPYRAACKDRNGNCLGLNEEIEENCFLYRCQQGSKHMELSIVGGGCNVNGVCKGEGSIWTEQSTCVDYKCLRETRNNKIYMIKSPVAVGCLHNGICRQHGEKWPTPNRKCMKTECSVTKGNNNRFKRLLKTTPEGCVVNGVCQQYGYTNYVGCIQYKCEWDTLRQFATYRYKKGGCKAYQSSTCHDVGDEWEEPYGKTVCLKLTCKQTGNRFHHDIKYMCQDADGYCVKPGEHFESLSYNGNRRSCYCKTNGNRVSAVCKSSSYGK